MMARQAASPVDKKVSPVCIDRTFAGKYPNITPYLVEVWWQGGEPRECSTLSIRMSPAEVFLTLTDPDLEQSAYTSAESLWDALELLDTALGEKRVKFKKWNKGRRSSTK